MTKPRIFLDMDGPLVDFDRYAREAGLTPEQIKNTPGAYAAMEPAEGALDMVEWLEAEGFDVWICTKPATGQPHCYAEKVSWVIQHLPTLVRKIIMTHDKSLVGTENDILVDDRPGRANVRNFRGQLIWFQVDRPQSSWRSLAMKLGERERLNLPA